MSRKGQLLDQSEARADNVRPMRRMEIADMKQEMLVRVSGQNTHTLLAHVWLASVGQSWRACYVRAQNTQRALGLRSQHPQSSQSGVMTLTGPGLHSAPQAGLGWDWVTDTSTHRVTRDTGTWSQLEQLMVAETRRMGEGWEQGGGRWYHVSAPLSSLTISNRCYK